MSRLDSAITLDRIGRSFLDQPVLSDVSFTLPAGKTLAILGPNGAGKTTLLKIMATLLRPHGGSAKIFGHDLGKSAWKIRNRIGLVAHDPMLYRDLSARENLRFQASLHSVNQGRIDLLLNQVGLSRRADDPLRCLSRGMVQRVAICRSLLHKPDLLLLDEPFANLDPAATRVVQDLMNSNPQVTRVIISHSPQEALAEADYVLGLSQGRNQFFAAGASVDSEDIERLFRAKMLSSR